MQLKRLKMETGKKESMIISDQFSSDLYDECDLTNVPECGSVNDPERQKCSKNYLGSINETYQGYKCKCWNDVTLSNRPSDTNSTITDNHNFCRNVAWLTDKPASKPWCYLHSEG